MPGLYIAFASDLERPYWAMFTVFIVANSLTGAVRSKTVFRLIGTVMGAAMALVLIPPLVDAPVLLSLAISLWIGLCLYLSLQDRRPRSYAFLLAGYTAGIVGFSVVNTPNAIFDTAVARVRVEEIEPWKEGAEMWRVLRAYFPGSIETHSTAQDFYFGADLMLRRHDYNLNIAGGFGGARLRRCHVLWRLFRWNP
jgi:Fusaric acid resistance protein family